MVNSFCSLSMPPQPLHSRDCSQICGEGFPCHVKRYWAQDAKQSMACDNFSSWASQNCHSPINCKAPSLCQFQAFHHASQKLNKLAGQQKCDFGLTQSAKLPRMQMNCTILSTHVRLLECDRLWETQCLYSIPCASNSASKKVHSLIGDALMQTNWLGTKNTRSCPV